MLLLPLVASFTSFIIDSGKTSLGETNGCKDNEEEGALLVVLLSVEAIRCSGSGGGGDESAVCCVVEDRLLLILPVLVVVLLDSDVNNCLCCIVEGRLTPGLLGSGCSRKIPAARAGHIRRYTRASLLYTYVHTVHVVYV